MSDETKEGPGFVVIDRRGEDSEAAAEPEGSPHSAPESAAAEAGARELPKADFPTFVLSLATSAMLHLGLIPDPQTGEPGKVDRELARHTIDTLEMLEEKTRGNLDDEESRLLKEALTELRMRYVQSRG